MALKYVAIFDSVFVMIDKNCSILPFLLGALEASRSFELNLW